MSLDEAPLDPVLLEDAPAPLATRLEWSAFAERLLPVQTCVFGRNAQITATYARLYLSRPDDFKWAGMAAFASHHVRLALWPLRLGTDRDGYADVERTVRRYRKMKMADVDHIRQTNNKIFADVGWAHLAFARDEHGLERLAALVDDDEAGAALLQGFGDIDAARKLRAQGAPREEADALTWRGNLALLRHEQEHMVQPHFDGLTCPFARLFSAASTMHFSSGARRERRRFFSSFYGYMLGPGRKLRQRPPFLPDITRLADRWTWIEQRIMPRYRGFEGQRARIEKTLRGFVEEARHALCPIRPDQLSLLPGARVEPPPFG